MNLNKKLFKAGSIIGYIVSFIFFTWTAIFYSLRNNIFIMFVIFALVILFTSLYIDTLIDKYEEYALKKHFKLRVYISVALSILSPLSLLLYIIAFFIKEKHCDKKVATKSETKVVKWYKKKNFLVSVISLSAILVSSFIALIGETSGFKVEVHDFTLTQEMTKRFNEGEENKLNGKNFVIESPVSSYGVSEYKPKDASFINQKPVIFVMPGFTRTKTTMAQYAIELSKRGAVVFVIDPGCQGATTYGGYVENEEGNEEMISSTAGANGIEYLVQYVYNNIEKYNYIDRDKIGAVGHSAGGGNVGTLTKAFAGSSYEESIIKSVYISGYIKTSLANNFKDFRANAAMSYAYYDEGAFRYQESTTAFEVIARRFVNEVNGSSLFNEGKEAIIDHEYGDMNNGTYRVIHQEDINHCFEMYDTVSIANIMNFFRRSLNLDQNIGDYSFTWMFKEAFNGVALASALTFIVAFIAFIIDMIPLFKSFKLARNASLVEENKKRIMYGIKPPLNEEEKQIEISKKRFVDKVIFWSITIISAVVACLDYIPLARLTMDWFSDAASNTYTFFFPARMMNAVMLWALFNGLLGFVLLFVSKLIENIVYKAMKKSEFVSWYRFKMMKIKWLDLLKTLLIAFGAFAIFYGLVYLSYTLFHQDFRFMLISASTIQPRFLVTWLIMIVPFFVFYLSNSARVNLSMATEGWSEKKIYIVSSIANSIGLVFILIINYVSYFLTGTVFFGYYSPTDTSEMWLFINMVFAIIPMMMILPIINRFLFKKSGNIYLGAIVTVMIFIMMSITASVSYIPM